MGGTVRGPSQVAALSRVHRQPSIRSTDRGQLEPFKLSFWPSASCPDPVRQVFCAGRKRRAESSSTNPQRAVVLTCLFSLSVSYFDAA
jgi:hypothetical protein